MARKAPVFHSEFRERILLTIRAPEGDSQRAVALRKLVAEMNERYATGHLTEWLVETLLEKQCRESLVIEGGGQVVRLADGAGGIGSVGQIESADAQRSKERDVAVEAHQTQNTEPASETPEGGLARKPAMPVGLRAMG